MILPDLALPSRINWQGSHSGIDSKEFCLDRQHFENYPQVEYSFNSRGFRDTEWPVDIEQLSNCVWCLGDSFTVGIGSLREHTWPYLLSQKIQQRTINVSMDGASNQWIARRAADIIKQVKPKHMVIMWSYLHRREHSDASLTDEQRRLSHDRSSEQQDWHLFVDCLRQVNKGPTRVVNMAIPFYTGDLENSIDIQKAWGDIRGPDWPDQFPLSLADYNNLPDAIHEEISTIYNLDDRFRDYFDKRSTVGQIIEIPWLDKARDGHHFDIITATWAVDQIIDQWQQ